MTLQFIHAYAIDATGSLVQVFWQPVKDHAAKASYRRSPIDA
jgi:hypothetical protein